MATDQSLRMVMMVTDQNDGTHHHPLFRGPSGPPSPSKSEQIKMFTRWDCEIRNQCEILRFLVSWMSQTDGEVPKSGHFRFNFRHRYTSHTNAHTNAHTNYEIQGSIDFLVIGLSLLMWAGMGRGGRTILGTWTPREGDLVSDGHPSHCPGSGSKLV